MQKRIILVGHHRNVTLAERNLSRLILKHGAREGRIVARRSNRGYFSKHGRNFTFELLPKRKKKKPGKKLFRWTVAITYPKGKKGTYFGYYLKHWQGTTTFSDSTRERATEIATLGLEKALNYPRKRFWFNLGAVTSIEKPIRSGEASSLRGTYELFADDSEVEVIGSFKSMNATEKFIEEFEN